MRNGLEKHAFPQGKAPHKIGPLFAFKTLISILKTEDKEGEILAF